MSLLDAIKKKKLKATSTTITTITGEKFLESFDASGSKTLQKLDEQHAGYVVDLKPDLQVAQANSFLYFGSQDVVADLDLLYNSGITHVLSLGVQPSQQFDGISYKFIDMLDVVEENLLDILPVTNDLINCVKNRPPCKIFVHCNAGCSRAPSIVIGYLIFAEKMSYSDAYHLLRKVRHIQPNTSFAQQLRKYFDIIINS